MSSPLYNSVISRLSTRDRHNDDIDEKLDNLLKEAEIICSTNVTQYYYAGTDQEFWHLDKHFPNLAPPFDSFWIETKAPTHIHSKVYGDTPWLMALPESFNTHRDKDRPMYVRPERWGAWFLNSTVPVQVLEGDLSKIFELAGLKNPKEYWTYLVMMFTQSTEHDTVNPIWSFGFIIDKQTGEVLKNPFSKLPDPFPWLSDPLGKYKRELTHLETRDIPNIDIKLHDGKVVSLNPKEIFEMEVMALLKPLLLAISFMHCRNVERVPNYPSPQLNKKRVSRNLPAMHKFYTLNIEPMKKILQQAIASYRGLRGSSGIEMALHKVKGHFKTYTPEKPLMGHAVGRWFWAGITRGSKKRGTIKKEYEVKM